MAVCTRGVRIGRIRLRDGQIEFDVPSGIKQAIRQRLPVGAIAWSSKDARLRVATLVQRVESLRLGQLERGIEAALVRQMAGGGKKKRADPLRAHQPVTFLGRAIQLPSPVAPRPALTGQAVPGMTLGHIDLLARHKRGILRVFEIKQESESHPEQALEQAVRYAAALSYLLAQDDQRGHYLDFFKIGYREGPTIQAVAFVSRKADLDRLHKIALQLNACNHHDIGLFAMTYERQRPVRGGLLQLDVQDEPFGLQPGFQKSSASCPLTERGNERRR
jgi:hypothetical protein